MLYARINRETKEVLEFPINETSLRDRFANTTLPKKIDDWALMDTDYALVPPGPTDLRPTITHRVGSVGAEWNEETGDYVRIYGLVEVPEIERPSRTGQRWRYLKEERAKHLRRYDFAVNRYLSEVRQGLTPTDDIEQLDAFAQKLRNMTTQYANPYMIDEKTFFKYVVDETE